MTQHDVFISYSREDRRFVRRLVRAFEDAPRGWSVWWDDRLEAAGRYGREIQTALESARCVVVIWSPRSVDSDWVVAEAEVGRKRDVLVPIHIADCTPPMPFSPIQSTDLSAWQGSETDPEWGKLLDAIQSAMNRGPEVDDRERVERQRRMEEVARRRRRMRLGLVALLALLVAGGIWGYRVVMERLESQRQATAAGEIASRSQASRERLLNPTGESASKIWWWRLAEDEEASTQLLATSLLAVEAFRRAETPETRRAIVDAIALLPGPELEQRIPSSNQPSSLHYSADGTIVVAAGGIGDTLVWDVERDRILARIPHGGAGSREWERERHRSGAGPATAAIHPDQKRIATAGPDESVRLWEIETGHELRRLPQAAVASAVAFSPDGTVVGTVDEAGNVGLWSTGSGERLQALKHETAHRSLFFSPTGRMVATVGGGGTARIWEVPSGRLLAQLTAIVWTRPATLRGLTFDPTERVVVTYGSGFRPTFWNIETGLAIRTLDADSDGGAIFDLTGERIVIGGSESLSWWEIESGRRLFAVETGYVADLDADGARTVLVSRATSGALVQAWDFESGRELRRIPYWKWPTASAVDPLGRTMVSTGLDYGTSDTVIELTHPRPDDPVAYVCSQVWRNFDLDEWQRYFGREPWRETCPGAGEGP